MKNRQGTTTDEYTVDTVITSSIQLSVQNYY